MERVSLPCCRIGGRERPLVPKGAGAPMVLYQTIDRGHWAPRLTDEIRLRKTDFDVLTNAEMIEKGLQRTDGLFERPVNEGQKATTAGAI